MISDRIKILVLHNEPQVDAKPRISFDFARTALPAALAQSDGNGMHELGFDDSGV
jgi:hypothetical protein